MFWQVIFLHGLGDTGYVERFVYVLCVILVFIRTQDTFAFTLTITVSKMTDMAGQKLSQASGYHM